MTRSTTTRFGARRVCALTSSILIATIAALDPSTVDAITTGVTGSGAPIDNMQPSLAMNYLVRIQGDRAGEIVPFAGSFAPAGWEFAEGQQLLVAQNSDLFAAIGTTYGGDGVQNFALPDLRGRTAIGSSPHPLRIRWELGDAVGSEETTLSINQMAAHSHSLPSGDTTSFAGGSLAIDNMQPSLVLNYAIPIDAPLPSPLPGATQQTPFLSQVRLFAGASLPPDHVMADGEALAIDQNPALFTLIGTTYGGDGMQTFGVPDLVGTTAISKGQGPDLSDRTLGHLLGTPNVALTESQLPAHDHTLPPTADVTGATGGNQPFDNMQPSLTLNYIIAVDGEFPTPESDVGNEAFLGQIALTAGNIVPDGWALANGELMPISQNTELFEILGTTYGGDGQTNFALPDLRGRTIIGAGAGPGLSPRVVGEQLGVESVVLSVDQLPPHTHEYVPEPASAVLVLMAAIGAAAISSRHCSSRTS